MNNPLEDASKRLGVSHLPMSMTVLLPDATPNAAHPLEVVLDYWGRNPHLQVLLYNHDDEHGEPKVHVRYDRNGKVCEVLITDPDIHVSHNKEFETPWEIERDSNPACRAGDVLLMPSGLKATVMTLHERYDNDIDQLKAYDKTYGIIGRLIRPDQNMTPYACAEDAWEDNPLTAGTVVPSDFSLVPRLKPTE